MVVEDSVGCAKYGFAVSARIKGDSETRLNVVFIGLNAFLHADLVVSGGGKRAERVSLWRKFDIVADAIVQSNSGRDAPRILPENSERLVCEAVGGAAVALYQFIGKAEPVALNGRESGKGWAKSGGQTVGDTKIVEAEGGRIGRAEVVKPAVVDRERSIQRNVIEVDAELGAVPADGPGKVVGELIALLDAFDERIGLAAEESVSRDIHGDVAAGGNRSVVRVVVSAPGVLKA